MGGISGLGQVEMRQAARVCAELCRVARLPRNDTRRYKSAEGAVRERIFCVGWEQRVPGRTGRPERRARLGDRLPPGKRKIAPRSGAASAFVLAGVVLWSTSSRP